MAILAVAFDLDGTLLDTEKLYRRFWLEAAHRLGYPMREEHALRIRSMAAERAEPLLREIVCPDFDYHAVRALRRELMDAYIDAHGVEPKPGMLSTLSALHERGVRIALASATPPERVRKCLTMVGALRFFDAIACVSMVPHGKPAPDVYLLAARQLGVAPGDALAVEDSPSGIRAAHAAGLRPVMVPDLDQPDDALRALCTAVVPTLTDVLALIDEEDPPRR